MWKIVRWLSLSLLLCAGSASATSVSQEALTPDISSPDAMMVAALGQPMAKIDYGFSRIAEGDSPMLVLQSIGQSALDAYSMLYAIVSSPTMSITQAVMKPIYFVAGVFLLTVGFMLGILIPFVPLMIFMAGVFFWFANLIVGVCGGPVWVFFLVTGNDAMRRQFGATLLTSMIDTILRPSLMVIGFISAGLMATGLLKLVFIFVVPSIFAALPVSFIGILAKLVTLMIIARICLSVVIHSFSLILLMPNAVMDFLGVTRNKIRISIAKGAI